MIKTPVRLTSYSVLVIAGDQSSLPLLRETLEAGYQLRTAGSGAAAFDLLSCFTPDLILADLSLPDINGLQLLSLIKPLLPQAPVIFLADPDQQREVLQGIEYGAEDYLLKPLRARELLQKVQRSLVQAEALADATLARLPISGSHEWSLPSADRREPQKEMALWLHTRTARAAGW